MYDKVVVVGSGKFPFQCAVLFGKYCPRVALFEYKASTLSVSEKLCVKHGVEYKNLDRASMTEELMKLSEKVLVLSAFNTYLFTGDFLKKENVTVVNYHNAYLPNHPGRNAEAWCIYEGDCETGVTWHYVTEEVDAGNIIVQEKIVIDEDMTALGLLKKQNDLAYVLLESFAEQLYTETITGMPQQASGERRIHLSKDVPNNGIVNSEWKIKEVYRFLRAMDYGVLNLLGTPSIYIDGKKYLVSSYRYVRGEKELMSEMTKEVYVMCDGNDALVMKLKEQSE